MTAKPIKPKSALGRGRAGAPTLMPAKRALKSVGKFFCQWMGENKAELGRIIKQIKQEGNV